MVYIANKQQCRKERYILVKLALFVRLEAKPGKEDDVENFLRGGLSVVQEEPATIAWLQSAYDLLLSEYLMPSWTSLVVKHISLVESQRH